jgi:hypothetical protein
VQAANGEFRAQGALAYSYQWERCGEAGESCTPIGGATRDAYTLAAADALASVRVRVTASVAGGETSVVSPAVLVSPDGLLDRSHPYVSGQLHEGQTLSAEPAIWTGSGQIAPSLRWQRCDVAGEGCVEIEGAVAATYALGAADVAHSIRVLETVSNTEESQSADSPPTTPIGEEPTAPIEVIEPTIQGPATVGQTFEAEAGTWAGSQPIAFAYQWQRCDEDGEGCADVEGATGSRYTLVGPDVGSTMRVLVTASNVAGSTETTSGQSEVVGAPGPPANTVAPEILGVPKEGQQLAAEDGSWSGSRPLTLTRRWERCEAGGEGCEEIAGATGATYTPTSADVGHTLRVYVTAANSLGTVSVRSAPSAPVASSAEASVSEAVKALEGSMPSLLAQSTTAQIEGETVKPASEDTGEQLVSTGAPTGSAASKQNPGELSVETPAGTLTLAPTSVSQSASKLPAIVNGTAAVYAETAPATDTVVRPDALGATTLTQLRSRAAPTSFSWELNLAENQQLEQLPDGDVAVVEISPEQELQAPLEELLEAHEQPGEELEGPEEPSSEPLEPEEGEGVSSLIEPLPPSPQLTTGAFEPQAWEVQPQDTRATYEADLADLENAEHEVQGATTLMVFDAPKAVDAAGNIVPSALSVEGEMITYSMSPSAQMTYPITAVAHVASRGSTHHTVPPPEYGLSDGHHEHFEESEEGGHRFDPRLTRTGKKEAPLHVQTARLVLWWDTSPKAEELLEWLKAVKAAGLKPFITLSDCAQGRLPHEPSCTSSHEPKQEPKHINEDVRKYREGFERLFKGLRKEYGDEVSQRDEEIAKKVSKPKGVELPLVTTWGAWNEPDLVSNPLYDAEPTHKQKTPPRDLGGEIAAFFWQAARSVVYGAGCHRCTVVAGEFADSFAHRHYISTYANTILDNKRYWQRDIPKVWGAHDYGDVGRAAFQRTNLVAEAFLTDLPWARLGTPHQWMTEGGVKLDANEFKNFAVKCFQNSDNFNKQFTGPCKAQEADAKRFLELHRITGKAGAHFSRLYYYEYRGVNPTKDLLNPFNSGLLEPEGVKEPKDWRPAYCVLAFHNQRCPPTPVTGPPVPKKTKGTAALLALSVLPRSSAARYWVEYGTTPEYGRTTTPAPVANEEGEQSETVEVTGLKPCTTYHYQAEAENVPGEEEPSLGGDETFTTSCEVIERIAGNELRFGPLGNGGPALDATIEGIGSLAAGPDGSVYFAEPGLNDVRRVGPEGIVYQAVGEPRDQQGDSGGGVATEARIGEPLGLTLGPDGELYVADGSNQVVWVDNDGVLSRFAGERPPHNYESHGCEVRQNLYSGDGGPALKAGFGFPTGLAVAPDGSLYISDPWDQVVRHVAADGEISTTAGFFHPEDEEEREVFIGSFESPPCIYKTYNGAGGYTGDGGPPASAELDSPQGLAVAPDGTLYIAEGGNNVVRKVSPDGVISTIAGTGQRGYSGDGGPATSAELNQPTDVALGPEGSLFVDDECNGVIRRIAPDGVITTVAGDGRESIPNNGLGGPPTEAELAQPRSLAVDNDGDLFIATAGVGAGGAVLEVKAPLGPGSTSDHGGDVCGDGGGSGGGG